MRIGQVTQDNYQDYLKILGIKDNENLDRVLGKHSGKDKMSAWTIDRSIEARTARAVAAGFAVDGMVVDGDDESWKKIVDVPDSYKQQAVKFARDMTIMVAKTGSMSAETYDKYVQDNKDYSYIMSRPPEERLAISWTYTTLYQAEAERLNDFIKSQVPGWQSGQPFDPKILIDSNFGTDPNYLNKKA